MNLDFQLAEHLKESVAGPVYVGKLSAKPNSADDQWAVTAAAGQAPSGGNFLQWRQPVNLNVTYRHREGAALATADASLRAALETFQPTVPVITRGLTPLSDDGEDAEGRHLASWQVQLEISIK